MGRLPHDEARPAAASDSDIQRATYAFLWEREDRNLARTTLQFPAGDLHPLGRWLAARRNPGGRHAAFRVTKAFLRGYDQEHELPKWERAPSPLRQKRP